MRPVLASLAAVLGAFASGVLLGHRWGVEDGHKDADRLLRLGGQHERA